MITRGRAVRLALSALVLLGPLPPSAPAQEPAGAEIEPTRVLVAPLPAGAGVPGDPIIDALPALIAEAVSAGRIETAALAHDLSPDSLQALHLDAAALPDAAALAAPPAAAALAAEAGVRILLLPSVEPAGSAQGSASPAMRSSARAKASPAFTLTLKWRDLVAGKAGTVSEPASGPVALIDAAGRATAAARREWSVAWHTATAAEAQTPAAFRSLVEITSKSGPALAAWARAGVAWNRGDVPAAEASLAEALAADGGFARAKVDLAWIRLGQERRKEAAALAAEALKSKRLSAAARSLAEIISAAGRRDVPALQALSARLQDGAPGAPWGSLASGLAANLDGDHGFAISGLDEVRLHRPNDPSLLHQAGLAAMGVGDIDEAGAHMRRAAALWPLHDRIMMDLAECRVRAHDLEGARGELEAWRRRFQPADAPTWGGEWTIEDPPPPVRALGVDLLAGSLTKAIETLEKEDNLLQSAAAPVSTRVAVLHAMHGLQTELAFGPPFDKQKWIEAARDSLKRLNRLVPDDQKRSRPWVLGRLEGLLLAREGRLPEARQMREKIMAASGLPGYDPAAEAEIEAAIALREAAWDTFFAANRRVIETRGTLEDFYQQAQGNAVMAKWKEVGVQVRALEERIETWNGARRRDAILWSPRTSALLPFIYSLGGDAAIRSGSVDAVMQQFSIFLAYFRAPDEAFRPFLNEAIGRGVKPAW